MDWIAKKERKKKIYRYFEMSFSCFRPFGVWGVTWTILQNTYEGTKAVKDSNLRRLTTSFEEIRMDDEEAFDEFYAKFKDIVNLVFNLGEKILGKKPKLEQG